MIRLFIWKVWGESCHCPWKLCFQSPTKCPCFSKHRKEVCWAPEQSQRHWASCPVSAPGGLLHGEAVLMSLLCHWVSLRFQNGTISKVQVRQMEPFVSSTLPS